jgi:tRNA-specific 2-thiouridylase
MARTVFAGLSGGVDSAVSAALLKERGYDVTGVFIKIWQPEFLECTWKEDRLDALRVAAALEIPFREIDLSKEYEREVIKRMLDDYRAGATPNPDVLCNRHVKFGSFAQWAYGEGADYVATGHYARVRQTGAHFELLRGVDHGKDQSYFLHTLSSSDLARTLFPVGDFHKSEVRALARRYDLPVRDKPDSQGLCFVGDVPMSEFLKRFIDVSPGAVLDTSGRRVGEHEGAPLYTVGQRHGFAARGGRPYYVVKVNIVDNELVVSHERASAGRSVVVIRDVHWIGKRPTLPFEAETQTRYRELPAPVRLEERDGELEARFGMPHVVSSGQSLVVYQGEQCLGGGIVTREERALPVHSVEPLAAEAIE